MGIGRLLPEQREEPSGLSEEEWKRALEANAGQAEKENIKMAKKDEGRGKRRSSDEVEGEPEAMDIMGAETNDESESVNEWDDCWDTERYTDQRTGRLLEEIEHMKKIDLYEEVLLRDCWE